MVGEENLVLATMGIAEVSIQSGGRLAHDPEGEGGSQTRHYRVLRW